MDITDRLLSFSMSYYRAGSKFGIYHWLTCSTKIFSRIFWLLFFLTHGAPLRASRESSAITVLMCEKSPVRTDDFHATCIIGPFIRGKITLVLQKTRPK